MHAHCTLRSSFSWKCTLPESNTLFLFISRTQVYTGAYLTIRVQTQGTQTLLGPPWENILPYMVIVSSTGRERECRDLVRDAGFPCYMPLYKERIVVRRRARWVEKLLLGRYFFARWPDANSAPSESRNWRGLLSIRLVTGLFMHPDKEEPALVRDVEIGTIRAREDQHGFVCVKGDRFAPNQRVRAQAGVLAGCTGNYAGPGRNGLDAAIIDMFGTGVRVEFTPGYLVAA